MFGDIHWGLRNDSEAHNHDCLDFIEWFCEQTTAHNCDTIIFLGDWQHNRVRTENRTSHYSRIGIELLDGMGLPVYWILGNHDIYLKNSRDIHSAHYLNRYKNIFLVDTLLQIGDVIFSPWLVGDEHEMLKTMSAKYLFGHFELPFFLMNQVIEKVYDGNGPHIDDFANYDAVYSGHFHKRQLRLNKHNVPIRYIGNCFGHDFNDVNDFERGMAILEWGETQPEYLSWPNAPTFHRHDLSEFMAMLEQGQNFNPRATIELIDDMNLSNETINEIKDLIDCRQIRVRKVPQVLIENSAEVVKYNSLDEMIEHQLTALNYNGNYEPNLLLELYRSI